MSSGRAGVAPSLKLGPSVLGAALVAFSGEDFPLSIVSGSFAAGPAVWLGGGVFVLVIFLLYRRVAQALPP